MEEKFVINKNIRSGITSVDDYISSLEEYLTETDTSSIKQLIVALDKMALVIAEDLEKIMSGEDETEDEELLGHDGSGEPVYGKSSRSTLKILSDSKDSKVYDRVMSLFPKVKDFQLVSSISKSLIPDIVEVVTEVENMAANRVEELKITGKGNSFEELQERKYKKGNRVEII